MFFYLPQLSLGGFLPVETALLGNFILVYFISVTSIFHLISLLHLKHLFYNVFSYGSASNEFFHLFLMWKSLLLMFILKRILLLVSLPTCRLAAFFFSNFKDAVLDFLGVSRKALVFITIVPL